MTDRFTLRQVFNQYIVILLAPFLLLAPLLLRGQALFWGTPALQFVPWWQQAWESLRLGVLPLWNPLNGMGAPLIANYQLAFFYPPNWLLLLFAAAGDPAGSAARIALGFTLLAGLHLAWGGLGMALLLRRLGFAWLGQIIGGLSFGLSGYIAARLGFFSMAWVFAWLPWLIYFAEKLVEQVAAPRARETGFLQRTAPRFVLSLGLAGCLAMQFLAGHAQLTWYSILLAGGWVTARTWQRCGWRQVLWAWTGLGAAGVLAAGMAAVQLLPTFEYLRVSHRADAVAFENAMTYSFWPWRWITLFSPDFFGNPAAGDYWGYASHWEDHAYTGLLPLLLAVATLWLALRGLLRRSRRPRTWSLVLFGWTLIAVTFLLALGKNTPVFPFLYRYVPTFDMFQAPARYLIWFAFMIPLLAAAGAEHWRCPTGKGLYWFRLGTAGAFAVTLGAGLASVFLDDVRLTFIRATALSGLWALGFGLLTLAIPLAEKVNHKRLWQWGVIFWTAADLLIAGWSLNPGAGLDLYAGASPAKARVAEISADGEGRVYIGFWDEYDLKFSRFLRFNDFKPLEHWRGMRAVLLPNLNLLDGISSANNFDPLVAERYARWIDAVDGLEPTWQASWLSMMGVSAVERIDVSQPGGVRFDPVVGASRWRWYPCARAAADGPAAWAAMEARLEGGGGPFDALILEGAPPDGPAMCDLPAGGVAPVIRKAAERPDRLELAATTEADGWLFLADSWYPGWQAEVDGLSQPVYPANSAFRAVYVPAGKHQIVFQYRPFGFYFGGLSSILVMLLVVLLVWRKKGTD